MFDFELEKKTATIDFVYTVASANIHQSVPNLAKICMTNRSRMSSIMNPLGLERPELFALELGEFDLVYTLVIVISYIALFKRKYRDSTTYCIHEKAMYGCSTGQKVVILDIESPNLHCVFSFEQCPC